MSIPTTLSDSEKTKSPFDSQIQKLSIKKIDYAALSRTYRQIKMFKKEDPLPPLNDLVEFIIERYNLETENKLKKINFPVSKWRKIDTKQFNLLAYYNFTKTSNRISKMLKKLDVEIEQSTDTSFLFILFRVHKSYNQIFALSSNKGYKAVQPYSDYTFPRKIALRLLDPDQRSKETSKLIIGSVLTSTEILRGNTSFDPNALHKIYTEFRASLKKTASLHQFPWFQQKGGKSPTKPVELEIKEGGIRINKDLPFGAYPSILDHLAKIFHGEKTFQYSFPVPTKRKPEQDAKAAFEFLDYFIPVSSERHFTLEKHLKRELATILNQGGSFDWTFVHPHINDYFKANDFRVRYVKEQGGPVHVDWQDYRKSFSEILTLLRSIPYLKLKNSDLERELEKIHFGFKNGISWNDVPLLACLSGQVRIAIDGTNKTYFKMNNKWYEISSNLLSRVDIEFRKLLLNCRIKQDQEGFLTHPWQSKPQNLTLTKISKKLKLKKDDSLETLFTQSVSFVSEQGIIIHHSLEGEILSHPIIHHFKESITELLSNKKLSLTDLEKKLNGNKAFAKSAWVELTKKRSIAIQKKITDKGKTLDVVVLLNPFPPKVHPFFKHKEQLKKWRQKEEYTMHEGPYNETYLYTIKNDNVPFTLSDSGWLVGDRILCDGIELFDIAHYTNDTIYLYHVKKSFDKARDALSQVMNSARMLSESGNQREKSLTTFFNEAIKKRDKSDKNYNYLQTVRKQFLSWGKGIKASRERFLELFTKRRIVFVYALSDDRATEHVITDTGLKKNQFSAEDFSTEKIKGVAAKIKGVAAEIEVVAAEIFQGLKNQQFLDDNGKKGARFPELYQVTALNFEDEQLQPYNKLVWQILVGDISYFGSLIGRMDLLHTRAQLEGLGFSFKICQILSPGNENVDAVEIPSLNWSGLDEDIFHPLQQQTQDPVLFYRSPDWFEEAECWLKIRTVGDGSCAFHSLFGEVVDGELRCDAKTQRETFVNLLKEGLNEDGNGFNDPILDNLYQSNLTSLIDEAERPDLPPSDPSYRLRKCAKMIFQNPSEELSSESESISPEGSASSKPDSEDEYSESNVTSSTSSSSSSNPESEEEQSSSLSVADKHSQNLSAFQTYLDGEGHKKEIETFKAMVRHKGVTKQCDLIKALKHSTGSQDTLESFHSSLDDDEVLYAACTQSIESLKNLSQTSKTYNWLKKDIAKFEKVQDNKKIAKETVLQNPDVMQNFLRCLNRLDYWLNDDELQMLAHVNEKRIEIIRRYEDGDYGCNNFQHLESRENDDRELVVIHGSGDHYSRCKQFTDDPEI